MSPSNLINLSDVDKGTKSILPSTYAVSLNIAAAMARHCGQVTNLERKNEGRKERRKEVRHGALSATMVA